MPKVTVYNMSGAQVGEIELSEAVFGIQPNQVAVHAVVKNYLANQRQGTQSALTKGEVSYTTKKPWRQKGTGRARAGYAGHQLNIFRRLVFDDIEDIVYRDHAHQPVFPVDDRHRQKSVSLENIGYHLLIHRDGHRHDICMHEFTDQSIIVSQHQRTQRHDSFELALT